MVDIVRLERETQLPDVPIVDTVYYIQATAGEEARQYVVGNDGVPVLVSGASPWAVEGLSYSEWVKKYITDPFNENIDTLALIEAIYPIALFRVNGVSLTAAGATLATRGA